MNDGREPGAAISYVKYDKPLSGEHGFLAYATAMLERT